MSSALWLLTTTWMAGADVQGTVVLTGGSCPGGNCGGHVVSDCGCNSCDSCDEWKCRRSFRDRMKDWFKKDDCGCDSCDTCDTCDDGCDKPTWFERQRSKFRSNKCDPCQSFYSKSANCGNGYWNKSDCGCDACDTSCGCDERKGLWSRFKGWVKGDCDDCAHGWDYVGEPAHVDHYGTEVMPGADEKKGVEKMPNLPKEKKSEEKKDESALKRMPSIPELEVPSLDQSAPATLPIKKSPY